MGYMGYRGFPRLGGGFPLSGLWSFGVTLGSPDLGKLPCEGACGLRTLQ